MIKTIWIKLIIHQPQLNEVYLHDCNWTRTHNHLVHKRTLNHIAKLNLFQRDSFKCLYCYLPRAGFPDFYRVNLCSGLLTTINIQQDIIYMPLFSARTAEMLFWLCFFPAIPTQNLVLVLNLLIFISPQRCDVTPIKLCSTRLLTRFLKSLNFFCFILAYQTFFLKSNFYYFGKQTLFLCF